MVFFVSRIMSNEISKNINKILKKNISILKYIKVSLNCHVDVTSRTRFDSTTLGITYFFMKEILQNHNRISKKDSIMCQLGQGRTATKPTSIEVPIINHLY